MAAEAKHEEERRQHRLTQDELARSKLAHEASETQAIEHQQEFIRAEENWAIERRLKDEICSMLFAILETAVERDMPIREVLNRAHDEQGLPRPSASGSKSGSLRETLKQFLDIAKRRMPSEHDDRESGGRDPSTSDQN